jgi:predicted transglutaminase-like cysteine proteinase
MTEKQLIRFPIALMMTGVLLLGFVASFSAVAGEYNFSYFLNSMPKDNPGKPVPLGGLSAGPLGYMMFCSEQPQHVACTKNTQGSQPTLEVLKAVNHDINKRIRFVDDRVQYSTLEKWVEATSAGDCEDIALAKMAALVKMGYSTEHMRLAMGWIEGVEDEWVSDQRIGHIVLFVDVGDKTYMLDNRYDIVDIWSYNRTYNFRMIQVSGTRDWVKF